MTRDAPAPPPQAAPTTQSIPSPGLLARAMRLHQWSKNALVFVPLVLGGRANDPHAWAMAALGFLALSLAASATYILNDIVDLESDREHWSKRTRPFASGALPVRTGFILAIGLGASAAVLGSLISAPALAMLGLYVALTVSYSLAWKRMAILDVFVVACLFTIRLGLGVVVTGVRLSSWLLVFSMFAFLSLSVAKRHTELARMAERGMERMRGRGYTIRDQPLTLGLGLASMQGAVLILILYMIEDAFPQSFYRNPLWLWLVPPIVFLFFARIWLLASRGELDDDPVAFALRDRVSLGLGLSLVLAIAAAVAGLGQAGALP